MSAQIPGQWVDVPYHFTWVRHGESVGNAQALRQGQGDLPLTQRGRDQIRALARQWRQQQRTFDYVLASPLRRAAESARLLVDELGLPEPEYDPMLMERDIGRWTLRPHEDVLREMPSFLPLYAPLGETGESIWDLYVRAGRVLQKLMRRPPARYLIVAHGGLINMMLYNILGIAPQPNFLGPQFVLTNAAYVEVGYDPATHRWLFLGLVQPIHTQTAS
ncbi:MAG: histidine phosphatase family protein [Chloroflexi bacterium]|nr:histidine phosphatase family protein [Chloroflexota bacterium]